MSNICPALESSLHEVISSAPAFRRPWAYLRRNLSGKYRVTAFGGNRETFSYLTRETEHAFTEGAYVHIDAPRQVRLLFSDPDITDFLLPNGHFRNGRFEVLSYITDERRTEDGTTYTLPADAQPSSETTATHSLEVVGNVFTNMPPRRNGYVRRAGLEEELRRVLCNDRHPVVTLQGRGGVGKTSLALEVLHDVAKGYDFFGIVWFSARDIDLLPEGPRVVKADVLSIEDVARDFATLMTPGAHVKLAEARQFFTDCLSGRADDGPFVFVLDNFETIREQGELYAYLSNAVSLPNKVLITTRTRDFKADYPIEVRGMTRDEYSMLVRDVAGRLKIERLIDSAYEEQLYEESDGHPYVTKVLLGEVAHAGHRVSLKRVVATKDAMLDALFDRSFAVLSPAAQRVFLTLCSWRSLVPRVGLEAVLLRPENERLDVERAISELEQTSLVEEVRGPDGAQPFLSVPLAATFFGRKKLVTSPLKIAIDADMELVREFGAVSMTEVMRGIGPRIDRLARAAAKRAEEGGDLRELAVIEYIATEYPPAWLNLAELQHELGDVAAAIRSVNRYLEVHPEDQNAWGKVARWYRIASDPVGEMHARLQLAELARPPFHDLSSAASRLNGLLSRREIQLDAEERRLMVRRLRRLMELRHEEGDATDLSRLAWLCIYDQDLEAADKWATLGLELDPVNEHCLRLKRRLAESLRTSQGVSGRPTAP